MHISCRPLGADRYADDGTCRVRRRIGISLRTIDVDPPEAAAFGTASPRNFLVIS